MQSDKQSFHMRRATHNDFVAIYRIWTQDHILPFMTFEKCSIEEFKPIFDGIMSSSQVYVIEAEGEIVATRRIMSGQGDRAHSVELASFGVDKNHLRMGYGKYFYEHLIEIIKQEKPWVKRVEIGQETDNDLALQLAQKMGFTAEVIFPDWIRRKTGLQQYTNKWNMGARFMGFYIDPDFATQSIRRVTPYLPQLPVLTINKPLENEIQIHREGNQASIIYQNKTIAKVEIAQGVRRFAHIQFWELAIIPDSDAIAIEAGLRKLAMLEQQHCKKIELYVSDPESQAMVQKLGFHCRGQKIGSRKINDNYYDELGTDLSFFNIQDAQELNEIYSDDSYSKARINAALNTCASSISETLAQGFIDAYAAKYLENLAFQMTREGIGEKAIRRYGQENQPSAPWPDLINALPDFCRKDFIQLDAQTTKSLSQELEATHREERSAKSQGI